MLFKRSPLSHSFNYIQKPARPPERSLLQGPVAASLPFGRQRLIGFSQVSSSFLREDQASHTADKLQGGFLHACTPLRCLNGVPRPKREPGEIRRVVEDSLTLP